MINPSAITDFKRSPYRLEEFLLFTIIVAGKPAVQQATKLESFIQAERSICPSITPFGIVRSLDSVGQLIEKLTSVKMGQYERISTAFRGVANLFQSQLSTVTVNELECIKGIGMKTSRFFIMHSRPNQQFACLDTHILKWLGEKGHTVPKQSPDGKEYVRLEKIFLDYAKQMNMLPADLDLHIWNNK